MDNLVEVLPNINGMTGKVYTKKEWLTFYKNAWTRNAMARAIDVETDKVLKAENAEQPVENEGQVVSVKFRLESRKIALQDSLNIIKAIDALLAVDDGEFDSKVLSKEALAVAEDMIPKPEVVPEVTPEAPAEEAKEEAPAEEVAPEAEVTPEAVPAEEAPITPEEEISEEAKV